MSFFPDDKGHPSGGEVLDSAASEAIHLAHRALERFPDLVKRHKYIAGGAAISSSLVVLAGVAITRRIRGGQTEEEALASVTEEELQGLRVVEPETGEVTLQPATNGAVAHGDEAIDGTATLIEADEDADDEDEGASSDRDRSRLAAER